MTAEEKRANANSILESLYYDFSRMAFEPMDNRQKGHCVRDFLDAMEDLEGFFHHFKDDEN